MNKKPNVIVILSLLGCFSLAQASNINWSGFMTVAAGKTLKESEVYQVEPTTAGYYEDTLRFALESMVGFVVF